MAVMLKTHRFTVDEYHRMGEAGLFSEDDRVELLAGKIVEMSPIGPRHAGTGGSPYDPLCLTAWHRGDCLGPEPAAAGAPRMGLAPARCGTAASAY